MPAALGLGFLLPIGLWLTMTAATERDEEGRAVSTGLLAMAASTLAFAGIGFALAFGGVGATRAVEQLTSLSAYLAVPAAGSSWGVAGASGFGLSGADAASLRLFAAYLPLVQSAALFAVGACYRRASWLRQALLAAVVGGLALPVPGFWVWGGGLLASLGVNLGFGHGALDLGGLTLAGLAGGAAAAAWLATHPRRPESNNARLPAAGQPMRAFVGAPMALIGAIAVASGNPLFAGVLAPAGDAHAVNTLVAAAAAAMSAQAYAVFVSRKPDALLSARVTLAAIVALSAGGALVTPALAGAVGGLLGLAWPVVHYAVIERLRWQDDEAAVATVLFPATVGVLLPGLFALGTAGAGLNGVGQQAYLGVPGLGVVGIFASAAAPDTGQLAAQTLALFSALAWCSGLALAVAWPRRRAAPGPVDAAVETGAAVADAPERRPPAPAPPPPERRPAPTPEAAPERPAPVAGVSTPLAPRAMSSGEGIISRLRRMSAERQRPPAPQQARKVAYPSRVAGKRLFARPIAERPAKPDDGGADA